MNLQVLIGLLPDDEYYCDYFPTMTTATTAARTCSFRSGVLRIQHAVLRQQVATLTHDNIARASATQAPRMCRARRTPKGHKIPEGRVHHMSWAFEFRVPKLPQTESSARHGEAHGMTLDLRRSLNRQFRDSVSIRARGLSRIFLYETSEFA